MGEIQITESGGGSFMAYVATPALPAKAPAVIVIQEIFGVNSVMRGVCDQLALEGWLAVCPDLFWRQEPGIQLTDQSQEDWQRAFKLYQGFNEAAGVEDLITTLSQVRRLTACNGKVGSMGFCLGGKLAFRMATRSDADCNVSFYGVGIENALDEAGDITKPLLIHIAEKDKFVPKDAQDKIRAAMDKLSTVTVHTYVGCDHAFCRRGGEHYDANACSLATERTNNFLNYHLGRGAS